MSPSGAAWRFVTPRQPDVPVRVCGLNCSLKSSDKPSNTSVMMQDVVDWMREHDDVEYEEVRVADYNVKPGVEPLPSDVEVATHPDEAIARAKALHES